MATNFYFRNHDASNEQNLYEDLIIESIRIYGEDMYYVPRVIVNRDQLFEEDASSQYNQAILVELYIKSVDGFGGDGNFMSKFGLQIRDQVVFTIAQRTFNQEVAVITNEVRPNEGDIIYFPLNKKCFQIKFVNKFEIFYQFGALQTWELTCELFEYSNEQFNTGIPEIDNLQTNYSINILDYTIMDEEGVNLTDEDGNYLVVEQYKPDVIDPASENDIIQDGSTNFPLGSNDFVDFSEIDPFSEGNPP
jgi:hypothetical protein